MGIFLQEDLLGQTVFAGPTLKHQSISFSGQSHYMYIVGQTMIMNQQLLSAVFFQDAIFKEEHWGFAIRFITLVSKAVEPSQTHWYLSV